MRKKSRSRLVPLDPAASLTIYMEGVPGRVFVVYIRVKDGRIAKSIELDAEVYADLDAKGNLLGLEFADPEHYNIQFMGKLTKKHHLPPAVAAIDPSKLALAAS